MRADGFPVMVFDNQCYLCTRFARFVDFFSRGRMRMVGHYTQEGRDIREEILDESALDMFWFIDGKRAHGGRAALLQVTKAMFSRGARFPETGIGDQCSQDCKTVKAVFVRSTSLFTSSRVIEMDESRT